MMCFICIHTHAFMDIAIHMDTHFYTQEKKTYRHIQIDAQNYVNIQIYLLVLLKSCDWEKMKNRISMKSSSGMNEK